MIARPRYEKLGLLALLAVGALVAFGFLLGIRKSETDSYHTFFDESVQGLEPGAFVKYRGVRIGSIGAVTVAPDGQHIDVALEIDRDHAHALAIANTATRLRARLTSIGITGMKFVDLVPAGTTPEPDLPFPTPPNYIPARRSTLGSLEGIVERIGDRLPVGVDRAIALLERLEAIASDARQADLPAKIATAADRVADAAIEIRQTVHRLDQRTDRAATRLAAVLDRVDGPDGLLVSARRATTTIGDLGNSARTSTGGLERTLRELRDAARAMRGFFEDLERQPDMIVKGRTKPRSR